MEYKVLYKRETFLVSAIEKLEKEINDYIKKGWKPLGGIAIDKGDCYTSFTVAQAIVKE